MYDPLHCLPLAHSPHTPATADHLCLRTGYNLRLSLLDALFSALHFCLPYQDALHYCLPFEPTLCMPALPHHLSLTHHVCHPHQPTMEQTISFTVMYLPVQKISLNVRRETDIIDYLRYCRILRTFLKYLYDLCTSMLVCMYVFMYVCTYVRIYVRMSMYVHVLRLYCIHSIYVHVPAYRRCRLGQ